MSASMAYPNGLPHMAKAWPGRMLRTERYGTERKNHQDPHESSCVSYPPTPVDNHEMGIHADRWMLADEQFELFVTALQGHAGRRTRIVHEQFFLPPDAEKARAYDEKTEQLRRLIAVERERWFAEQRSNA